MVVDATCPYDLLLGGRYLAVRAQGDIRASIVDDRDEVGLVGRATIEAAGHGLDPTPARGT